MRKGPHGCWYFFSTSNVRGTCSAPTNTMFTCSAMFFVGVEHIIDRTSICSQCWGHRSMNVDELSMHRPHEKATSKDPCTLTVPTMWHHMIFFTLNMIHSSLSAHPFLFYLSQRPCCMVLHLAIPGPRLWKWWAGVHLPAIPLPAIRQVAIGDFYGKRPCWPFRVHICGKWSARRASTPPANWEPTTLQLLGEQLLLAPPANWEQTTLQLLQLRRFLLGEQLLRLCHFLLGEQLLGAGPRSQGSSHGQDGQVLLHLAAAGCSRPWPWPSPSLWPGPTHSHPPGSLPCWSRTCPSTSEFDGQLCLLSLSFDALDNENFTDNGRNSTCYKKLNSKQTWKLHCPP